MEFNGSVLPGKERREFLSNCVLKLTVRAIIPHAKNTRDVGDYRRYIISKKKARKSLICLFWLPKILSIILRYLKNNMR